MADIKQVKLIAKKTAPSNIWVWSYIVEYKTGARRKYTDETLPYSVDDWIHKEKEAGRIWEIQNTVTALVGWKPPEESNNKIIGGIL